MKNKILIADDEPQNITVIAEILEESNFEICAALNGDSACKIAVEQMPDLIILDWNMPGMSGIEATKFLKRNPYTKNIPIMIISGIMTSSENLNLALEAGAIDFIRKPVDKLELLARTRSMLLLSSYYQETVSLKNRELLTTTIKLSKNNEYLISLKDRLNEVKELASKHCKPLQKTIFQIIQELNFKLKTESWNQFETYFNQVNPKFIQNLIDKHPGLSPNEIKLCSFLVLNLDTKEIAAIVNQKTNSIRIARTRLRKKLNMQAEDNLVSYLIAFTH